MIESVRANARGLDYEIVIVDSGSIDGTPEYLMQQPDVVFIQQGERRGAVSAFNEAFARCSKPYVMNANDDILVHGDLFREAIAQMRDPAIGQVAFPFSDKILCKEYCYIKTSLVRFNYALYANFGVTRKSIGDAVGWWGNYYQYSGDCELSANIWNPGYRVEKLVGDGWVEHLEVQDATRQPNTDSPKFYAKWKDWKGVDR